MQAVLPEPWLALGTDTLIEAAPSLSPTSATGIVDEVFLSGPVSQQRWRRALGSLPVLWVGVRCDREVAAAREIARGNRIIGMAAAQADLVHEGTVYDLEVDTGQAGALECARTIAAHVKQLHP